MYASVLNCIISWCWERLQAKGKRQQRITWLDSITDSLTMDLSKLQEIMKDRDAWNAAKHGVTLRHNLMTGQQEQIAKRSLRYRHRCFPWELYMSEKQYTVSEWRKQSNGNQQVSYCFHFTVTKGGDRKSRLLC